MLNQGGTTLDCFPSSLQIVNCLHGVEGLVLYKLVMGYTAIALNCDAMRFGYIWRNN
jgi:hypothetical protein